MRIEQGKQSFLSKSDSINSHCIDRNAAMVSTHFLHKKTVFMYS